MGTSKTIFLAAICIFLSCSFSRLQAQSGITNEHGRRVTCASDDGRRHLCPVDTSRGVRMVNQRSDSPCIQGRSWGYDNRGIWVDRGCRADFVLRGNGFSRPPAGPSVGTITCSSNDGNRRSCPADTRRGVRMVNQRSDSPCIQGRSWGYDNRGIWVDRGCRADFVLGGGQGPLPPQADTVTCSSNDGNRRYCSADTRRGVRMVRQRSDSPCIQGRTWGYDGRGIWVDRGCRADFSVGGR